jgi:hypothetical protein
MTGTSSGKVYSDGWNPSGDCADGIQPAFPCHFAAMPFDDFLDMAHAKSRTAHLSRVIGTVETFADACQLRRYRANAPPAPLGALASIGPMKMAPPSGEYL